MVRVNYELMETMEQSIAKAERKANDIQDLICRLNHAMNLDMDLLMQPSSSKILKNMLTASNDMMLIHEKLEALTKATTGLSQEYQETEHTIQDMLNDRAHTYVDLEAEFTNLLSPDSDETFLECDDSDQLKKLERLLGVDHGNINQADASSIRKLIQEWYHLRQVISE